MTLSSLPETGVHLPEMPHSFCNVLAGRDLTVYCPKGVTILDFGEHNPAHTFLQDGTLTEGYLWPNVTDAPIT